MEIRRFSPDDGAELAAFVDVTNAASAVDSPWVHPLTLHGADGRLRYARPRCRTGSSSSPATERGRS